MESFKKWMDRVVGKRPDITADWSTTNAETLVAHPTNPVE